MDHWPQQSNPTQSGKSKTSTPLWLCHVWRPVNNLPYLIWHGSESWRWKQHMVKKASEVTFRFWMEGSLPQLESRHLSPASIWVPIQACVWSLWMSRISSRTGMPKVKNSIRNSVKGNAFAGIWFGTLMLSSGVVLFVGQNMPTLFLLHHHLSLKTSIETIKSNLHLFKGSLQHCN